MGKDYNSGLAVGDLQNMLYSAIYCSLCSKYWFILYICIKKSHVMHFSELILTIKERREAMRVTQETLAEISGVGLRTLKQFESGKGNPTLLTVQKLADVLGFEVCLKLKNVPGNQ
jgi:DNA-binding XRE family transcriptional regulator